MASIIILMSMAVSVPATASALNVSYAYNLASFNGTLLTQWGNIYVDRQRNETYIIDQVARDIKIYNEYGMAIYIFGDTGNLGVVYDLTVDANGDIIVISTKGGGPDIIRCNYRGEPIETIELKELPAEFSRFRPSRIVHREGKLYLADTRGLRVAVTDMNGVFETGYDIATLIEVEDQKRDENEMSGFSVDAEGNMLFTVSVKFAAYRLSPDGRFESFGYSGSAPGAFGIVAGIVSDDRGFIYVSDKLKSAVLVFDDSFEFQTEFGFRGNQPHNLMVPNDIDTDGRGNIFVSQGANRGISVFKAQYK